MSPPDARRAGRSGVPVGGSLRLERHPVALGVAPGHAQAGRLERGPDVALAVDEDARGEQPAARRELRREVGGERDEHRRDEVGDDEVEGTGARRAGSRAGRAADARRGSGVRSRASPRRRSGPCRRRPARRRRGAPPRSRGSRSRSPTSSSRARPSRAPPRASRPSSAQRSMPARQSRVVGCRPVPNAIPGSSAMTMSPGRRRWRRHVGRMTIRRPIRRTPTWRFQAVAQSDSWTTCVRSSPISRRSKAWRWPSARSTSSTAARTAVASRAGT